MSVDQLWRIVVATLVVMGVILTIGSLTAESMGLGPTPTFGALQMFAFLTGLTCLTIAGYLYLRSLRPADTARSLQADIGMRLSATGLVLAAVSGFADLISIGTHIEPVFGRPFVGPLQMAGLLLGIAAIIVGMVLYHTSRGGRPNSSLSFFFDTGNSGEAENS